MADNFKDIPHVLSIEKRILFFFLNGKMDMNYSGAKVLSLIKL